MLFPFYEVLIGIILLKEKRANNRVSDKDNRFWSKTIIAAIIV